jgi:hypothetical protein
MPRFSTNDIVFRQDSGANAATVLEVITAGDEVVYRLVYDEGGEGYWPEGTIFLTIEDRAAANNG